MQPFSVGEDLDVLKAGRLHVGMAGVGNAVHLLVPEAFEPAPVGVLCRASPARLTARETALRLFFRPLPFRLIKEVMP